VSPAQCDAAYRGHTAHARGVPAKISAWQLLVAMLAQVFAGSGTLVLHVRRMTDMSLSSAALALRRRTAGWPVFASILRAALRPMADALRHPGAFYGGLRLVALDATEHSLVNTPAILGSLKKAAARRACAAFAKLRTCVLLELHAHNPLHMVPGLHGECELTLARSLFGQLPAQALLLADRLYGVPAVVQEMLTVLRGRGSHLLVRVRRQLKVRTLRVLRDGSALIAVRAPAPGVKRRHWPEITLREIRGRVQRAGGAWSEVRLWTSLEDAAACPARELLALYAQRWEHELYYRELKAELQGGVTLLRGHSVESAAQELACVVLASALLARVRLESAAALDCGVPRVSLRRVRAVVAPLWMFLELAQGEISERQQAAILAKAQLQLEREALLPARRPRRCARAVRAPVGKWPRLLTRSDHKGHPILEITRFKKTLT
jgi:hypothetical protein